LRLLTLTAPELQVSELRRRVNSLAKRVRLDYGQFEYCGAIERGSAHNVLHVHLAYFGEYMPQSYLSRTAARRGLGQVVDVREASADVAGYLAKQLVGYLAKDQGAVGRGIWSTRWLPEVEFRERVLAELGRSPSSTWRVSELQHAQLVRRERSLWQ